MPPRYTTLIQHVITYTYYPPPLSFQVPRHVIALIFIIICPAAIEEQYQLGLIQSTEPLLCAQDEYNTKHIILVRTTLFMPSTRINFNHALTYPLTCLF